jgi:high-affinity iron transporter
MNQLVEQSAPPSDLEALVTANTAVLKDTFGFTVEPGGIGRITSILKHLQEEVAEGKYDEAEELRLEAYAAYEIDAEPRLLSRNGELGEELQELFWQGSPEHEGLATLVGRKAPPAQVNATIDEMLGMLTEAETVLNEQMSPAGAVTSAVALLVREGLEAVLVIAAVLGYLRATKAPARAQGQVLGGAGLAIVLSLVLWAAAQTVISISSANRELLEGVVALIAAAVLFYVTNWLLHKVYITDWMTFVRQQVQRAMNSGSVLGLMLLGFVVVFREGFETVLFLQALMFDAPAWAVAVGTVIGALIIVVIAVVILRFSSRLPLKPFFTVTSVLMLILAVSFVGNGLRNLQEAGLIGVTRFDLIPTGLLPSLVGLFPTLETVLGQVAVLALLALTFTLAKLRTRSNTPPAASA